MRLYKVMLFGFASHTSQPWYNVSTGHSTKPQSARDIIFYTLLPFFNVCILGMR